MSSLAPEIDAALSIVRSASASASEFGLIPSTFNVLGSRNKFFVVIATPCPFSMRTSLGSLSSTRTERVSVDSSTS